MRGTRLSRRGLTETVREAFGVDVGQRFVHKRELAKVHKASSQDRNGCSGPCAS